MLYTCFPLNHLSYHELDTPLRATLEQESSASLVAASQGVHRDRKAIEQPATAANTKSKETREQRHIRLNLAGRRLAGFEEIPMLPYHRRERRKVAYR
jgi:hypothetical protein